MICIRRLAQIQKKILEWDTKRQMSRNWEGKVFLVSADLWCSIGCWRSRLNDDLIGLSNQNGLMIGCSGVWIAPVTDWLRGGHFSSLISHWGLLLDNRWRPPALGTLSHPGREKLQAVTVCHRLSRSLWPTNPSSLSQVRVQVGLEPGQWVDFLQTRLQIKWAQCKRVFAWPLLQNREEKVGINNCSA